MQHQFETRYFTVRCFAIDSTVGVQTSVLQLATCWEVGKCWWIQNRIRNFV